MPSRREADRAGGRLAARLTVAVGCGRNYFFFGSAFGVQVCVVPALIVVPSA